MQDWYKKNVMVSNKVQEFCFCKTIHRHRNNQASEVQTEDGVSSVCFLECVPKHYLTKHLRVSTENRSSFGSHRHTSSPSHRCDVNECGIAASLGLLFVKQGSALSDSAPAGQQCHRSLSPEGLSICLFLLIYFVISLPRFFLYLVYFLFF